MYNQKIEPLLNLALALPESERSKSSELDVGYDEKNDTWELIVRYVNNIDFLKELGIGIVYLINNYAILYVRSNLINILSNIDEIIYIEKPKSLYYSVLSGRRDTGIDFLINEGYKGKGILTACIDSGIDFFHKEFRDKSGRTRIYCLWDQESEGIGVPSEYGVGSVLYQDDINKIIDKNEYVYDSAALHGTHVAGIMAGNTGVASESDMIIVKLLRDKKYGFPLTSQIMMAVDFVVKVGIRLNKPLAINLSIGNNYGSHDGTSLLETFIDTALDYGRNVMCVGVGNEGGSGTHAEGRLREGAEEAIELLVGEYQTSFSVQLWKEFVDDFEVRINPPGFLEDEITISQNEVESFVIGNTRLEVINSYPSPYSRYQEIYIDFISENEAAYILQGVWRFRFLPKKIVDGRYDMWLPAGSSRNDSTRFLRPSPNTTITIPATSRKVISVGAYDSFAGTVASFSGRGYTRNENSVKPDIVAPGVNIRSALVGGGYTYLSGTSMACPFATGICAILMEKYILGGLDPYLYGQKMKEYIIKNARKMSGQIQVPDREYGYGGIFIIK